MNSSVVDFAVGGDALATVVTLVVFCHILLIFSLTRFYLCRKNRKFFWAEDGCCEEPPDDDAVVKARMAKKQAKLAAKEDDKELLRQYKKEQEKKDKRFKAKMAKKEKEKASADERTLKAQAGNINVMKKYATVSPDEEKADAQSSDEDGV